MYPYLSGPLSLGNASSIHRCGREARAAMDTARESVARLFQADFSEIYFTPAAEPRPTIWLSSVRCLPPLLPATDWSPTP